MLAGSGAHARIPARVTASRILLPTDFGESDGDALALAARLAPAAGAELLVMHVVEDPAEQVYGEKSGEGKDRAAWALWKHAKGDIEARLTALVAEKLPGLSRVRPLCAFGDPAARIVETAKSEAVDLVVLSGRRKSSLLQGMHLGNVAYRVVRMAPCDVLLVR